MNKEEYEVCNLVEGIQIQNVNDRLEDIEVQLKKFSIAIDEMKKCFRDGVRLYFDEKSENFTKRVISDVSEATALLRVEVYEIHRLHQSILNEMPTDGVTGALKFMAKALHELREHVHSIKENGIKKDIQLSFTLDGYEMRKQGLRDKEIEKESESSQDFQEATKKLLDTLSEKEGSVLKHRFGLLGENRKIFNTIGEIFGVSATRIKQIQSKALRKCKHSSRKHLVDNLTHVGLKKAILGKQNEL